jgi:hypothetical protein
MAGELMAKDTDPTIAALPSRVYGTRSLGALLPGIMKPSFRKRPAALAQILLDWDLLVGPSIARLTRPRKIFSGTLTIACDSPTAMELQHQSPMLIERINTGVGRAVVQRLRFVPLAQGPAPARRPPPPDPRLAEMARERVARLPPGELRDSLERLGRAVLEARSTNRANRG